MDSELILFYYNFSRKASVVNLKQMFHSNAAMTISQKWASFLNSHWSFRHHIIRADFAKFGTIFWVDSTVISIILKFDCIDNFKKCEKNKYSDDFHDLWKVTTCWQIKDSEFFCGKILIAEKSEPRLLIKLGALKFWLLGKGVKWLLSATLQTSSLLTSFYSQCTYQQLFYAW